MKNLTNSEITIRDGFNALSDIELKELNNINSIQEVQKTLRHALKLQEFVNLLWNKKVDLLLIRYANGVSDYNNQTSNELYHLTEEEYRFITTMILTCCLQ